jgi:peptidoglycan hydrolase CwlO-like protein
MMSGMNIRFVETTVVGMVSGIRSIVWHQIRGGLTLEKETYDQRIKKLEKALKEARDERAKALARQDVLAKDLEDLNRRIADLGCQPEELEARIREARREIETLMQEIEQLIPAEYLERAGW